MENLLCNTHKNREAKASLFVKIEFLINDDGDDVHLEAT